MAFQPPEEEIVKLPQPWRARRLQQGALAGGFIWAGYMAIRWAPFKVRYQFVLPIAKALYQSRKEKVLANLVVIRPEWSQKQAKEAGIKLTKTLARSWSFVLGHDRVDQEKVRSHIYNAQALLSRYQNGEKAIVIFSHIGPVNELVPVISALGLEAFAPAEALPPMLFRLVNGLRAQHGGVELMPVKRGETIAICQNKLAEGKIVVLAADIPPGRTGRGVTVRVGAAKTTFAVGAVKLALLEQAPIFLAEPYYNEKGEVVLWLSDPYELRSTGNLEVDIESNANYLYRLMAKHIELNLADWWRLLWADLESAK